MRLSSRWSHVAPSSFLVLSIVLGALALGSVISSGTVTVDAAEKPAAAPHATDAASYEKTVEPILKSRCYDCHSKDTRAAGGLLLDDRESILRGGRSGPAAIADKPDESLLIERIITSDDKKRMPKGDDALPEAEIAALRAWVAHDLPWSELKAQQDVMEKSKTPLIATAVAYPRAATAEQLAYFEKNVRPILVNRCYNCHSDAFKEAGGLRVDVGISIFAGGNTGPAIVPGHPEKSLLIERVKSSNEKQRMPQESKEALPAEEIAILERWIKDGAAWPDETEKLPQTPGRLAALYPKLKQSHWSWQPLTNPGVPVLQDAGWASGNIDRYVLAKLDEKHLAPVADADTGTLVRRITFDLTGLPPTPEEVRAFQRDHSPQAYAKLVDRLLASPRFGERWGRHWLDIARYGESSGPSRNMPYPNAWRYRDYVIDAVNRDVPYNRFLREQIAGDLLPASTPEERDRLLIATGYLALGPKDVNQRFKARYKMDNVDDLIDTVTRSTMAITVSCARCHDHKFDPIPTKDYYALAGIFTSTDDNVGLSSRMGGASLDYYDPKHLGYMSAASSVSIEDKAAKAKLQAEAASYRKQLDEMNAKREAALKLNPSLPPPSDEEKKHRLELRTHFIAARENLQLLEDKGEHGYGIHSMHDGVIADTTVRVRGVEERHGPTVPRGFLTVLSLPNTPTIPADHSGRLELADWIARPDNPLTTRVYVNRVWQHLFGRGIVVTQDNFGVTGGTPSDPALLDYLANDFVEQGWSTKKLIREIVLSHVYRLGSDAPAKNQNVDPENQYVWRHSPRRMDAEEIRDSILASAGDLDLHAVHGSPTMALRMIEVRDDGPAVASILKAADGSHYRSIYLPLLRDETPRSLAAFDPVTQTLIAGKREVTTVSKQSLFMLNSPFVREQSLELARNLLAHHGGHDGVRIAYEKVLGRDPSTAERKRVTAFLREYSATWARSNKRVARIAFQGQDKPNDPARIIREDGLAQDDEVEDAKAPPAQSAVTLDNAQEAAWSAFVQSLYGSAAFQFVH
ncbi:MAG: PSD1 and planctomycete cytochrome C domain-containing protein [Acidobacteriaceae bacterium]|nr:PSD1 and planctomycete cytochrome C domain-containing protein [Acidobacteriaceae bacterium]